MENKVQKKKTKTNKKVLDKRDKVLLVAFAALLVLVAVLLGVALNLKNSSNVKANITIPILTKTSTNELSVDLSEMTAKEEKEYIFKVSNYKGKEVANTNITYTINITPSENASIELYKNSSKNNLLEGNNYTITKNSLPKSKKKEDEYHLIIKVKNTPAKNDRISLKINS